MSADLLALIARGMAAASLAILIVLAVRWPVRRCFGARVGYGFWLLVPAVVAASYIPARIVLVSAEQIAPRPPLPAITAMDAETSLDILTATALPDIASVLLFIWLAGVVYSLFVLLIGQQRALAHWDLRRDGQFYRASSAHAGPALVGVFAPRIALPADFEQRYTALERSLVLAHERAHIRAGDAQINALAAFAQCLNWFNPLFYIARRALRIDQELACDERVMREHAHARRAYAEAMLKTQLVASPLPLGCHWPARGAGPLKQRIAMLGRRAPSVRARIIGAYACAAGVLIAGLTAWAAQPPQLAYAETSSEEPQQHNEIVTAALGAQLVEALDDRDAIHARELIDNGADVNFLRAGDGTPLITAVRNSDATMVSYLIQRGADVNRAAPQDGNALIVAAGRGDMELVRLLVGAGADVNGFVEGDETPLINAARQNNLDVARYLIEHGADANLEVDAPTWDGGRERRSPMSVARARGHSGMMRLLRERGARG